MAKHFAASVFLIASMCAVAGDTKLTPEFLRQQSDDAFELWSKICFGRVLYQGQPEKEIANAGLTPVANNAVERLLPKGLVSAWRRPGPKGPQGDIIVSLHSPRSCTVMAIRADARYGSEKFLQRMKEQEEDGIVVKKVADEAVSVGNGNTRRMIVYQSAPSGSPIGLVWVVTFTDSDKLVALILESAVIGLPTDTPGDAPTDAPKEGEHAHGAPGGMGGMGGIDM